MSHLFLALGIVAALALVSAYFTFAVRKEVTGRWHFLLAEVEFVTHVLVVMLFRSFWVLFNHGVSYCFIVSLAFQFSGPVTLVFALFYWYFDFIVGLFTFGVVCSIFMCIYYGVAVVIGYTVLFLFGLVFNDPEAAILRLYGRFLVFYAIFFILSFFVHVYTDLWNLGFFNKVAEFLPVAHCMRPEDHEFFFQKLEDLIQLLRLEAAARLNETAPPPAADAKSLRGIVVYDAVQSLLSGIPVLPANDRVLYDITLKQLILLAEDSYSCALNIKYKIIQPSYYLDTPLKEQQLNVFELLLFKSYLNFFFASPDLFPGIKPEFCDVPRFTFYYHTSYMAILNNLFIGSGYEKFWSLKESHLYLDSAISSSALSIRDTVTAFNSVLKMPPQINTTSCTIYDLSSTHGNEEVFAIKSIAPHVQIKNCTACGNESNFYTPAAVVVCPGGATNFFYPPGGKGSLNVIHPDGYARVLVDTPEYTQRVTACWDNLADAPDTRSYSTWFRQCFFSEHLTDQEYSVSLQTTKDLKLQKAMLAGLETPPVNAKTEFLSYSFPKKWHFIDGQLELKLTDPTVKFTFDGGKFGVEVVDSHRVKWHKLVAALKTGK